MSLAKNTKPISYLKANAAKISKEIRKTHESLIITQNGEATMVVQSIDDYQRMQDAMALLKILTLGKQEVASNQLFNAQDAFSQLRKRRNLR